MKKSLYLLFCLIFISCFTEPKKELEKESLMDNKKVFIKNDSLKSDNIITNSIIDTTKINTNEESLEEKRLDKIYLGKHLFHQGGDGTFGKCFIDKKNGMYYIIGEHKMLNNEWIKIEGLILNPTIDNFTFRGKILMYSPSSAKISNTYKGDDEPFFQDDCIWEGETQAIRPQNRKYWRIKKQNCYHYFTDLDVFF